MKYLQVCEPYGGVVSFRKGDRVELHPATDAWMSGARFGIITGWADKNDGAPVVRVKLDKRLKVWRGGVDLIRHIDSPLLDALKAAYGPKTTLTTTNIGKAWK